MRTALSFLVKNRGAELPGFYIEFEMVRFNILRWVYPNDLPVNGRDFRLPEKQVIRNGAIKKLRNEVECFFYCGVKRREPLRVERGWWQKEARGHECE